MAQILDAGTYRARAVEAALGFTGTGKEQVAVKFQLLDPGLVQSNITWYGYFTDGTIEGTFRALRSAGWKGQDLSDLSDLAGAETPEVDLVIHHEADQKGVMRARVRWVNSVGGVALKTALAPDRAKVFAAKMRGKLAAFDHAAGTERAPAPAPRAAPAPRTGSGRGSGSTSGVPQEVLDAQEAENASDGIPF